VTFIHGLRCLYSNVDSFNNKKNEINARINDLDPDIIGFTEVNPKSSTWNLTAQELLINGYTLYSNLDERGSVLYIKDKLQSVELQVSCKSSTWCSLKLKEVMFC